MEKNYKKSLEKKAKELKPFSSGTMVDKSRAYIEDKTEFINYEINNSNTFFKEDKGIELW
ncbi:hypothetical protein KAJ87_02685 [Candidatus Pacearchaeota archaeon]|nr:hypothetical protein [Candidatus Pacearchaeota archaeon]